MNKKQIKAIMERRDLDTDRKRANAIKRAMTKEQRQINQKPVKSMTINIEWKKSKTWGSNPHATAHVLHIDGTHSVGKYTCSGCGYDKESTVISRAFNDFLLYRLHKLARTCKKVPYGVHLPGAYFPYFDGGIGTGCYFDIAKFIGGTFRRVASGDSFDAYELVITCKQVNLN